MRHMVLLLIVLAVVVAACGDDGVLSPGGASTTQAEMTTTTESVAATTTQGPVPTTTVGASEEYDLAAGVAACQAGDDVACDLVYLLSDLESPEEAIGLDCGGRGALPETSCSGYEGSDSSSAYTYGDDPLLDALWDMCAGGNDDACDHLYFISPVGSEYETFGSNNGVP